MTNRRWLWAVLVALGLSAVSGGNRLAHAEGKIVIYAAEDEKTLNALTTIFTEKTGIQTEAIRVPAAGTLVARLRAEKDAPKADVFIGGSVEFHQPLAEDGLTVPYDSPAVKEANIDPVFVSPKNFWHGWFMGSLVILLNPERFDKEIAPKGIAKPKTWDDLLNPAYEKNIASGTPASCGGAYI